MLCACLLVCRGRPQQHAPLDTMQPERAALPASRQTTLFLSFPLSTCARAFTHTAHPCPHDTPTMHTRACAAAAAALCATRVWAAGQGRQAPEGRRAAVLLPQARPQDQGRRQPARRLPGHQGRQVVGNQVRAGLCELLEGYCCSRNCLLCLSACLSSHHHHSLRDTTTALLPRHDLPCVAGGYACGNTRCTHEQQHAAAQRAVPQQRRQVHHCRVRTPRALETLWMWLCVSGQADTHTASSSSFVTFKFGP